LIYLLDTNICIYALNRRPPEVLEKLRSVSRSMVSVSVITVLELRQGAEKSRDPERAHQKLDFFLSSIRALPFEEDAAFIAARIRAGLERQGRRIGDLDSLIAAQALAQDLILVTNNLREFDRVPDLRTENWV
jgi:tRNA(fMet)-specific endonuclease VapC